MKLTKKLTKRDFARFVRENRDQLWVREFARFSGMTDAIETCPHSQFRRAEARGDANDPDTLGIAGIWLVNHGGDHFYPYSDEAFSGVACKNCCGHFAVAIKR